MVPVNDLLRLSDVLAGTGVTYRQLDYWTRQGWVRPEVEAAGSGYARAWHPDEARVVAILGRLAAAGVAPPAAARVTRDLIEQGWAELVPRTAGSPALEVVFS